MYDVLGLNKDASHDDIKKAYRNLARKHHPDKGGDPEQFKKVQEAYDILSDPDKRRNFDQFGDPNGAPQHPGFPGGFPGGFPADIFAQMFGGQGGRGPLKRANHEHVLNISLEEAYRGLTKNIKIGITRPCFDCMKVCKACNGQGKIQHHVNMGPFSQMFAQPCGQCNQVGKISEGCGNCNRSSVRNENLNFELKIPPGVGDGFAACVRGMGEQAQLPTGEESGDLILIVKVNTHPDFMRQGNDLIWISKISFENSVNGVVLTCPHFDGPLEIDTGKWGVLDPRKDYIIQGKGMPGGNLRCAFDIQYPNSETKFNLTKV